MAAEVETLKVGDLRQRSAGELESLLTGAKEELYKLRFKQALGQLGETHRLGLLKKSIARINTLLAEQGSGGAAA